jgi:hypothetical protein
MKKLMFLAVGLMLVGCQSSTTNSYVFIGDEALKQAKQVGIVPKDAKIEGLKLGKPGEANEQPDTQGSLGIGDQAATNGTCIVIAVNSTTSKPVDVSTANGNQVSTGKSSSLEKAGKVVGAAVGGAAGGPAGAAAGSMLPEAASVVVDAAKEAMKASGQ